MQLLVGLVSCTAAMAAVAAPTAAASETSYPDTSSYHDAGSLQMFRAVDREGVWFTTGMGLNCRIDEDGSYGCSGSLPEYQPVRTKSAGFPATHSLGTIALTSPASTRVPASRS